MAKTLEFRGDAPTVAQVDTLTVGGTITAGDLFKITINGKTVTVAATNTDAATTAGLLVAAFAASTEPEFLEVTASSGTGGVMYLTANTAGKPFTATVATTESNGDPASGQTFTTSTTTANSGPNVVCAANFRDLSGGANSLPGAGDTVYFRNSSVDLKYNLGQLVASSGTATYHFDMSYTGQIGLPAINSDGTTPYNEYRQRYFFVDTNSVWIGEGTGNGSTLLQLCLTDGDDTSVVVYNTGSAASGSAVKLISNNSTDVTIHIFGGTMETLIDGPGATFDQDAIYVNGGTLTTYCGTATVATVRGGTANLYDVVTLHVHSGTVTTSSISNTTTINQYGGLINHAGYGLTTLNLSGAEFTFTGGSIVTSCAINIGPDSTLSDLYGAISTATITCVGGADLNNVRLNIRKNKKLVITDP